MNLRELKHHCAAFYGLTLDDMESRRRARRFARPRQVAMALARHYTRFSQPQIGRAFGGRDHTTVLHAIRTIERLSIEDGEFAAQLALLCAQIEARFISQPLKPERKTAALRVCTDPPVVAPVVAPDEFLRRLALERRMARAGGQRIAPPQLLLPPPRAMEAAE